MLIDEYFQRFQTNLIVADVVHSSNISYDKRTSYVGFIKGIVYMIDGSLFHVREFLNVEHGTDKYMYAYHYQRADDSLVFRYDNTDHFRALPTFPHHKHVGSETNVVAAVSPDLATVLAEVRDIIAASAPAISG